MTAKSIRTGSDTSVTNIWMQYEDFTSSHFLTPWCWAERWTFEGGQDITFESHICERSINVCGKTRLFIFFKFLKASSKKHYYYKIKSSFPFNICSFSCFYYILFYIICSFITFFLAHYLISFIHLAVFNKSTSNSRDRNGV